MKRAFHARKKKASIPTTDDSNFQVRNIPESDNYAMATDLTDSMIISSASGGTVSSQPQGQGQTVPGEDLTPLEQDLLDEYERLADNMKKVRKRNKWISPP